MATTTTQPETPLSVLCCHLSGPHVTVSFKDTDTIGSLVAEATRLAKLDPSEVGEAVIVPQNGEPQKLPASSQVPDSLEKGNISTDELLRPQATVMILLPQKPLLRAQAQPAPTNEALRAFLERTVPEDGGDSSHTGATQHAPTEFSYTSLLNALNTLWHWCGVLQTALRGGAEDSGTDATADDQQADEGDVSFSDIVDKGDTGSNDPNAAMEWLLTHESDPTADDPLSPPPKQPRAGHQVLGDPDPLLKDSQLFQQLKSMGFTTEQASAALQITRNNFDAACELLLQGFDVQAELAQHQQKVANFDSPIAREILKDPLVHTALCNPHVKAAIGEMMADTNCIGTFLFDPVVGPMLRAVITVLKEMPPEDELV